MTEVLESTCLGEGCSKVLEKPWWKFCPGCNQKRWRANKPQPLGKHIEERHTYPYRTWLASMTGKEVNVVHCVTKVLFFHQDPRDKAPRDWFTAPLCDSDAQLRPQPAFRMKPRLCQRCVSVLQRVGLVEDWMLYNN